MQKPESCRARGVAPQARLTLSLARVVSGGLLACIASYLLGNALSSCVRRAPDDAGGRIVRGVERVRLGPMGYAELGTVSGNAMHEAHLAEAYGCGTCHPLGLPPAAAQAQALCLDCHSAGTVLQPVWLEHCTACHLFRREPVQDGEEVLLELCAPCHEDQQAGQTTHAFCRPAADRPLSCATCHQPHEHAAVRQAEVCRECHGGLLEPATEAPGMRPGHPSCTQCHSPHVPAATGPELCRACHQLENGGLVHTLGVHPEECTACHDAHFADAPLGREPCAGCHEGRHYREGADLPSAHRTCEACHRTADFEYRGSAACADCHTELETVLSDVSLPGQHRRCAACHLPHVWRVDLQENCAQCHDQVSAQLAGKLKADCSVCHAAHRFAADEGSCRACHSGLGEPHAASGHGSCLTCHRVHAFDTDHSVCGVCHAGLTDHFPGQECVECHTFR